MSAIQIKSCNLRPNSMFLPRFKRYSLCAVTVLSLILIFFNEFLIYSFHRFSWSSIRCHTANCTSILFVSDPQILGETFDTNFYSNIAIDDSDQFLRKTFARAFAYSKPDVICFLGDLMDEGSIASDEAYQRYLSRFNNVFKTSASVKKFYIPGDNDIGGDQHDYVTAFKTNRFHRSFNETSSVVIGNRLRFRNINLLTHIFPELNETDGISAANKLINIVLTHISVLYYPGLTMKTIMDQFKPNIIFSGHSHLSRLITYPPQHIEDLVDNRIVNVGLNNFNAVENSRNFTEISIPACSYRMGVNNIGYGYAVIDGNQMYYTVLWSPDRFKSLWSYVIWLSFLILVFSILLIYRNCSICRRRVTYRFRQRLMIATDKF